MLTDIAAIAVGILLIVFRKSLLKLHFKWQTENTGRTFSEKEMKAGRIMQYVGGVVFILIGVLGLVGILS